MTWQARAACIDDDPREWDDAGTLHAHYICRQRCTVRDQCLTQAMQEKPLGQMRAGVPFGVSGGSKPDVSVQHERWYQMYVGGMSYSAIGREVGRHHTTVMAAIRGMEAVA